MFYTLNGEAEPQRVVGHPVLFEAVPAQQQQSAGLPEGGKGRQPVLHVGKPAQQQQSFGQPAAEGAAPWRIMAMQCFLTAVGPSA